VTALACAIAFTSSLAFAGWVLWLRERRGETFLERLAKVESDHHMSQVWIQGLNLPSLVATVTDLALKQGLRPKA
jgi:hypothetical protein